MTDQLSRVFAALADPTRRAILARLASEGEARVTDVARPFDKPLDVERAIAERRLGLPPGGRDHLGGLRFVTQRTHPFAAATGRGFHEHREPDLTGGGERLIRTFRLKGAGHRHPAPHRVHPPTRSTRSRATTTAPAPARS